MYIKVQNNIEALTGLIIQWNYLQYRLRVRSVLGGWWSKVSRGTDSRLILITSEYFLSSIFPSDKELSMQMKDSPMENNQELIRIILF